MRRKKLFPPPRRSIAIPYWGVIGEKENSVYPVIWFSFLSHKEKCRSSLANKQLQQMKQKPNKTLSCFLNYILDFTAAWASKRAALFLWVVKISSLLQTSSCSHLLPSKATVVFRCTNEFNKGPSKTLKSWLTCHTSSPPGCIQLLICLLLPPSKHCQSTSARTQPAACSGHCYYYLSDKWDIHFIEHACEEENIYFSKSTNT